MTLIRGVLVIGNDYDSKEANEHAEHLERFYFLAVVAVTESSGPKRIRLEQDHKEGERDELQALIDEQGDAKASHSSAQHDKGLL